MGQDSGQVVVDDAAVARYWRTTRDHLRAVYATPRGPASWAPWHQDEPEVVWFGTNSAEADQEIDLLHDGAKTAWSRPKVYFDGIRPEPRVGDVAIVVDGDGQPVLMVTVNQVAVARFADVSPEYAEAEALGDEHTLSEWRRLTRERFTDETGLELAEDAQLYLLRISVV